MTLEQRSNRRLLLWLLITLLIALLPWFVFAQDQTIKKEKFNVNKEVEDEIGYSQAIKVGSTLYISGVASGGPMPDAIKQVYDRIEKIRAAQGATFQNVVKENVFTVDLDEFIRNKDLRKPYFKRDYPAATWVEVKRLYVPEIRLEVEMTAILSK
jgi:enamine deaminase RidA (YjgF/YER057c/UK114 family)